MPSQKKTSEAVQTKKEDTTESDSSSPSFYLCSDEKCLGFIGPEGVCLECGKPKVEHKEQKAVKQSQGILCVAGTCSGIIGEDGCCKECGMPHFPESEGGKEPEGDGQQIFSSGSSPLERSFLGKFIAAICIIGGVVLWPWGYYENDQEDVLRSLYELAFPVLDGSNSQDTSKSPIKDTPPQVFSKKGNQVITQGSSTIFTARKKTPSVTLPFSVEKPPVGSDNVLGIMQIRYCLAEEVILKGMDIYLDTHSQPEVKAYNFYIDDYYERCKSFRHRSGDLAIARKDIEKEQEKLLVEGKQRLFAVRASSTDKQAGKAQSQTSPSLVKDIQKELKFLGYDPGPVDGLTGVKTSSAIKKFQWVIGQKVDGKTSYELLEKLRSYYSLTYMNTAQQFKQDRCEPGYKKVVEYHDGKMLSTCILKNEKAFGESMSNTSSPVAYSKDKENITNFNDDYAVSDLDRSMVEYACSQAKDNGPAAYKECYDRKIQELLKAPMVDFTGISGTDRSSIKDACSSAKKNGPGAYQECLARKIKEFKHAPVVHFATLYPSERSAIINACSSAKKNGPGAYKKCLAAKVMKLEQASEVNFAGITSSERSLIQSACSYEESFRPGAYTACLARKIEELYQAPIVDFSGLTNFERSSVSDSCSYAKYNGPGAYNECLARKINAMKD